MSSPVPPQTPGTIPPGWYHDPASPMHQRYWDGSAWTHNVAPLYAVPAPTYQTPGYQTAYPPQAMSYGPGANADRNGPDDPLHWILPVGRSGESIAAGYLGLFSLVIVFLGPFAILFGVLGLRRASRGQGHGRGRSIFGIVAGVWGTFWTVVVLIGLLARH